MKRQRETRLDDNAKSGGNSRRRAALALARWLATKEFPFRLSDDLVLVPVSNGAMISFRIESVTEVTIKAEGAIRHAVLSGSVYAIDLFNWYNDWTGILMRYGDYKE